MRTVALGFVCVVALVGCGRRSSNVAPPVAGQQPAHPSAPPVNSGAQPIESRLTPSEIPKTPEAFKDEFVRRFNEDNYGAFRDLCYWEGVPEDVRRKNMELFTAGLRSHQHHITSARIEPCSPDQVEDFRDVNFPAVNLSPTHVLYFESVWKGEVVDEVQEESGINGRRLVGTNDGDYYLCAGVLSK